jgi:NAD(P)-dependent dehydrogenase (short-subunit alcohol dehydrogenase family)
VKHLACKGAKVYLGARSEERGKAAVAKLQEEGIGSGEVIYLHVDISTPVLAHQSAQGFLALESKLDVLGMPLISIQTVRFSPINSK